VPNVVVDANTVASAALKAESRPETALLFALIADMSATSVLARFSR